jgi:hypothetical protein
MGKAYGVAINPVLLIKDFGITDLKLVGLDKPIGRSLKEALNHNGLVTDYTALGSLLLDGEDGEQLEVGLFVDSDAEMHGETVNGKRQPGRLNSLATLIRRAALGAMGENPISVAPVCGRVVICKIDDDRDPHPLNEAQGYIVMTQLAELLGNGYLGDERFDQKFLDWMSTQEVQESAMEMAKVLTKIMKRDGGTMGDLPYPEDKSEQKKELVH